MPGYLTLLMYCSLLVDEWAMLGSFLSNMLEEGRGTEKARVRYHKIRLIASSCCHDVFAWLCMRKGMDHDHLCSRLSRWRTIWAKSSMTIMKTDAVP